MAVRFARGRVPAGPVIIAALIGVAILAFVFMPKEDPASGGASAAPAVPKDLPPLRAGETVTLSGDALIGRHFYVGGSPQKVRIEIKSLSPGGPDVKLLALQDFLDLKSKWGGSFIQYRHVTFMAMSRERDVWVYASDDRLPVGTYVVTFLGGYAAAPEGAPKFQLSVRLTP